MRTCPKCGEPIGAGAEECPHCRADLTPHPAGAGENLEKSINPSRLFIAGGILLLGLWAMAWFIVPWHFSGRQLEAQELARDSLAQVQTAIDAYKTANGVYPASLGDLPEPAWLAIKKAKSAHYEIRYVRGGGESSGGAAGYTLAARARDKGFANYFTDETQVFRSTTENRDATKSDPAIRPDD